MLANPKARYYIFTVVGVCISNELPLNLICLVCVEMVVEMNHAPHLLLMIDRVDG